MASLLRPLPVMPGQPSPRQRRLPPVRCLCNGPITSGGIINDAGPVAATSRAGLPHGNLAHRVLIANLVM